MQSLRKSWCRFTISGCLSTWANPVFAAGNRWSWTVRKSLVPLWRAAKSSERSSGMWHSAQFSFAFSG